MEPLNTYEKYPLSTVFVSNLQSFLIYVSGFYILSHISWILAVLYLGYAFFLETNIIKNHCTRCYYYAKTCGFGKGRISSLFFRKSEKPFCAKLLTWKDMIPDMLVPLIPLISGLVVVILDFDWMLLLSLLLILLLTTAGNAFIRGKLTCNVCRQRLLGCPADALFNDEKSKSAAI